MKLTFGKGLIDSLACEAPDGYVTDCLGFRFRNGFAEAIGGSDTSAPSATFAGLNGNLSQLYTAAATFVVGSTSTALTAFNTTTSTPTAITRKTQGSTIASATAAGTTVTITTTTNHGLVTTNVISAWGFNPTSYNVESAAITRISNTVFTYVVPVAPAVTPATDIGRYSDDSATSNVTLRPGGELNGILILNSTNAGCYYWSGDVAIPARRIAGSFIARASVPFGNFIVQLAPTISSVEYPFRICWSNASEPGTVPHNGFTPAVTNQAGDVEKPEIGEMVWAHPLGDDLIVYGTKGRILMRYIGGNDVFQFKRLPGGEGLLEAGMVVETPVGHVFVDRARHVRLNAGGVCRDISLGRVQNYLGDRDATGLIEIAWVALHSRMSEVWIGYKLGASPAATATTSALVWNWDEDTWGRALATDLDSIISAQTSTQSLYALANSGASSSLFRVDDQSLSAVGSYIERIGLDAGSADVIKDLQQSRWNIENPGSSSTLTVEHGSSMFADTAPTYATGVTYTPGTTDYAAARATGGRYLAVKLSLTGGVNSSPLLYYTTRVRSADIQFTTDGTR